jgi:hypothetical protein
MPFSTPELLSQHVNSFDAVPMCQDKRNGPAGTGIRELSAAAGRSCFPPFREYSIGAPVMETGSGDAKKQAPHKGGTDGRQTEGRDPA